MGRVSPETYSFSHSEMDTFKQCRRKWYLSYYLKLRRRREPRAAARDTGILVHGALNVYYMAGGMDGEDSRELMFGYLEAARDEDKLNVTPEDRKTLDKIHDTSLILCTGYLEWLHDTGADVGYEFDQSEVELRTAGPVDGTEIMGIIDLGGTMKQSGDLFVMDTKVTAQPDAMVQTLHMSEQGPMYAVLAKILEPDTKRGFKVIWNMIKNNKQTAKAKPPFYQRYELAINADQLRQFYAQLHGQITDILRLEERLNNGESHVQVAYPTPMKDCTWKCQFFPICGSMNDETRNDIPYLIGQLYSTLEEREAAKLEELKNPLDTQREGDD